MEESYPKPVANTSTRSGWAHPIYALIDAITHQAFHIQRLYWFFSYLSMCLQILLVVSIDLPDAEIKLSDLCFTRLRKDPSYDGLNCHSAEAALGDSLHIP